MSATKKMLAPVELRYSDLILPDGTTLKIDGAGHVDVPNKYITTYLDAGFSLTSDSVGS